MKLLLCCAGLAFLALTGVGVHLALVQAERVAAFAAPVQARVLEKRLEIKRRERVRLREPDTAIYRPIVRYAYEVQGQEFTSEMIFPEEFGIGGNLGRVAAQAPLDLFEKGQTTTAYYNPERPSEACLIRRPSVLPYVFALAPVICLSGLIAAWPSSMSGNGDWKRRKAHAIAVMWHVLGLMAAVHYFTVAGRDFGGSALVLFGLYAQLGLIPVLVALPPAKSSSWASRLDGGIMGSLVGTFIGFWLGLVIGLVVLFLSSKATLTLQCWGYTPAILAALLGVGGWLGAAEEEHETESPKDRKRSSRNRRRPRRTDRRPTSKSLPPPKGPVPYAIDRRPFPQGEDLETLLPADVGPYHRQWVDHRDDVRNVPIYAQYESRGGEVFVELGIQEDAAAAQRGIETAQAETDASFSDATQSVSLNTEPSFFQAETPRGAFFAWTRGCYYFSAHARGGREDLDRFIKAFPY